MIISLDDDGQRLDRFLKKTFPTLTFGQTQKLVRTGQIRINGGRVKGDAKLSEGDDLRLPPSLAHGNHDKPRIQFSQADRNEIESLVLYEDESILAINKPAGLAVQGGTKTRKHIDGMMESYAKKGVKPRLCHRLDRDTSGVLILGKTAEATRALTKQFQLHEIQKTYWTLTSPVPAEQSGTINAPICKSSERHNDGDIMVYDEENGKKSVTDFEVIEQAGKDVAFVAFYPRTGRTHQIRVHAYIIGSPILGDYKYNPDPMPFGNDDIDIYDGLHLHAREIELRHPITKQPMVINAPLSKAFLKSWKSFGFNV